MGTQSVKSGSVTFSGTGIGGISNALSNNNLELATEKIVETIIRSGEVASQLADLYTVANRVREVLQVGFEENGYQKLGDFIAGYVVDVTTNEVTRNLVELFVNKILGESDIVLDSETKDIIVSALSEYFGEHITQGTSLIDLHDLFDPTGAFVKIVMIIGVSILLNKIKSCREISQYYYVDTNNGKLRDISDRDNIINFCKSFSDQFVNDIITKLDYKGEFNQKERMRIERKIKNYMKKELKEKCIYPRLNPKPRHKYHIIAIHSESDKKYRLGRPSEYKKLIHLPNSELDFRSDKRESRLDNISAIDDDLGELTQEEEDFLNLIRLLFASERESDTRDGIILTFHTPIKDYWKNRKQNIEKIFEFLTGRRINIELIQKGKSKIVEPKRIEKVDEICLLSGGIDSLAGAIKLIKDGKKIACVYVSSAGHVKKSVDAVDEYLKQIGNGRYRLYSVSNKLENIYDKGDKVLQTRALVYLSIALIYARRSGAKKIAIPESGPTMINIPINDSVKPTRTVHPDFLESLKLFFNSLFDDYRVEGIYSPLGNMTKVDAIHEIIIKNRAENIIPQTTSCFKMRTSTSCGKCYGCVTRRLSCIFAGIEDCTYEFDIFTDDKFIIKNNSANLVVVLDLVELASKVLNWDDLDARYKLMIKNSGKEELLKRFYAQILYAVYLKWKENKNSESPVLQKFKELIIQDRIKLDVLRALL